MYPVCVKMFQSSTSLEAMKSEAAILISVSSEYTPHCFGVCEEKRAIVMSRITLSGRSINLHTFLNKPPDDISFTPTLLLQALLDISNGLRFIHSNGILLNDIKLDNIVSGNSLTRTMKAYVYRIAGNFRMVQIFAYFA